MTIVIYYYGQSQPPIRVEYDNDDHEITIDAVIWNGEDITYDASTDLSDISFEVSMALRVRKADAQDELEHYRGEEIF